MEKKNVMHWALWSAFSLLLVCLGFSCREDIKTKEPELLEADRLELTFPASGGSEVVKVKSSMSSWIATSPQEGVWVHLEQTKDALNVKVSPNSDAMRMGYILLQGAETTPVKIKLTQEAGEKPQEVKKNRKYVMPLLEKTPTAGEIARYEVSHNSILKSFLEADPHYKAYDDLYFFLNDSELFPEVLYAVRATTKSLVEVSTLCNDYKKAVEERQNLINFYKENEFEILSEAPMLIRGRHKTKPFNLKIAYTEGKGVIVSFEQYAPQANIYPTFSVLPEFPQEYYENQAWKLDRVKEVELNAGSKEGQHSKVSVGAHKGEIVLATFIPSENKKPLIHVGYYFHWESGVKKEHEGTIREIAALYNDVSLGFWEDTTITGTYIPTNEFNALLEKDGWQFLGLENYYYGYYNAKKKMMLACKATQLRGINDDKPCVQLNFFPATEDIVTQNTQTQNSQFDKLEDLYRRLK